MIYRSLYQNRNKISSFKSIFYNINSILMNFYSIRLDVIHILRWNNVIRFILKTYLGLTSLYYSTFEKSSVEIFGTIIFSL